MGSPGSSKAMSVRIFLSSTAEDLAKDCRPNALRAIERGGAVPIAMEKWIAEFKDPVLVCREKIERDSTHFVGIFAYRRGWVPPGLDRSITEIELDCAQGCAKPMAVLLPNGGTGFAAELRLRARDQSPEDRRAQEAFLARLWDTGVCPLFDDAADLEGKVSIQAFLWSQEGLRRLATREAQHGPSLVATDRLLTLGRREQVRVFASQLKDLGPGTVPCAFVIHGPPGSGQAQMLRRLRILVERGREPAPRIDQIDLGVSWRGGGARQILETWGRCLEPGFAPETPAAFAGRLRNCLAFTDVVLELHNLQEYPGGVPSFLAEIWRPLADHLGRTVRVLIGLFTLDRPCPPDWQACCRSVAPPAESGSPNAPVLLPELRPFTAEDLLPWLLDVLLLPPEDAEKLTEILLAETAGKPENLYRRMQDLSDVLERREP
jgi:Domain of unknown function (DUF4062)/inactive STAND